ncbi:hypothetical protein D3C71_1260880 [compost metagenome]
MLFVTQFAARNLVAPRFRRCGGWLFLTRAARLPLGFRFAAARGLCGGTGRWLRRFGFGPGVAGGVWLRRSIFLLEQAFDQRLVGQCRTQIRLTFQCLFVSVQGRLQLTAFGQGIASIVVGVGIVAFGKPLGGACVVAGLIERHALPLMIFEASGGLRRALLLE